MKRQSLRAALAVVVLTAGVTTVGAYDEYLQNYTMGPIVVTAERTTNKFGDTKTTQSYYRTGGDVKVITREEIEKRHYADLTDAIKRIPGITFQNPGYRGGEYGYQFYQNGIAINGDTRVVILVDGVRMDNPASTRVGSSSSTGSKGLGVNLDQVASINDVDKIEVIKGPGAAAYGSDATGGVINIITRQGGEHTQGSVDLGIGNWGKRKYDVTVSGAVGADKKTRVFVGANKVRSNDTEYVDGITGQEGRLYGSKYDEKSFNFRVDHDFGNEHSLKLAFNYKQGRDGYPLTTPNLVYWNATDWNKTVERAVLGRVIEDGGLMKLAYPDSNGQIVPVTDPKRENYKALAGQTNNPGYSNLFVLDGLYQSFSEYKSQDWTLEYTFKKVKDMPSFLRFYTQQHHFSKNDTFQWVRDPDQSWADFNRMIKEGRAMSKTDPASLINSRHWAWKKFYELYPNGATQQQLKEFLQKYTVPFAGDAAAIDKWIAETGGVVGEPNEWNIESKHGVTFQYADSYDGGKHDVITELTYERGKNTHYDDSGLALKTDYIKRDTFYAYVQDKIHMNSNWDLTPSIRYAHYTDFKTKDEDNTYSTSKGSSSAITGALNTEYRFDKTLTGYLGITNIHRPLRIGDYTNSKSLNGPLRDEKGMVYTLGLRKRLNAVTTLGFNMDITNLSNAIATLPVIFNGTTDAKTGVLNASELRTSYNLTLDTKIGDAWTISAAYTHLHDKWKAKDGVHLDSTVDYQNSADINTAINKLRPRHHVSLNVAYEQGKVYTGLLTNFYLGNNTKAFTARNFVVLDWSLNYKFNENMSGYIVVNNLTNTAYQTVYSAYNGINTASMPARSYMAGLQYKF